MWTDTHCHLGFDGVADDAVEAAGAAGVGRMICVGTDAGRSREAVAMAARWPGRVWATVGVHPHDATGGTDGILGLVGEPGVVGIGECGLDYHYEHSPRDVQRAAFAAQVGLAHVHAKTLVIHSREAWADTFAVLLAERVPSRTVFHCFTGGPGEAETALELGAYLSFSGIVTFPRAEDVQAAAAMCPADRLLVETDAPFLAPVPHRGKPNQPALVAEVGAAVARLRGVEARELAAVTSANAARAFGLPAPPPLHPASDLP